jgi:DNA primase
MAGDTVQQIKDKLSIVDVVSQYVKLDRAGNSLRARCPFHAERTPSFHVSPERGTYHCFGCNVGGDIFTFVQEIEGLDFKGALKVLADKAGVEIVYEKGKNTKGERDERERLFELLEIATIFYVSRLDDAARAYLVERGMQDETLKNFRIGWAGDAWSEFSDYAKGKQFSDKELLDTGLAKKNERGGLTDKFRNRIMFPIADSAGRVIGFSGRTFGENASPEAPKYLNSPETALFHKSRILYGFDRAKVAMRKNNFAVLVEGQMDLLASHQAGWANTVAVSGTAFTPEHAALVKRMSENLVLALDADQAGIKAAGRAARAALAGGLNVKVARLPSGLDPADLILQSAKGGSASGGKEGVDAWRAAIRDSKDIITFLLDVLEEHAKGSDSFRRSVETVVLPFLADVASPIAREQYIHEIAQRLGVSAEAVGQALAAHPHERGREPEKKIEKPAPVSADRARHAYSLLTWQESMPRALIDTKAYERSLVEAIGHETLAALRTLPALEQERLRFSGELHFGDTAALKREAEMLLTTLLSERLRSELKAAGAALKEAEARGDEAEMTTLMDETKLLTGRIAELHRKV